MRRTASLAVPGADFLMREAVADCIDRLRVVTRTFPKGVALLGRTDGLAEALADLHSVENVLRIEEEGATTGTVPVDAMLGESGTLPLEPGSIDLVVVPWSLHYADDLPGMMIQIARALRPDGLFMATLPGGDTLQELRASLLQAESELRGGAALRVDAMTDIRDAGALLQRAGFALPVIDSDSFTVRYDTMFDLIRDLRGFGATSVRIDDASPPLTRAIATRAAAIYAENFSDDDGRIRATFQMISLSGWSPHDSQQKPLKPGSATIELRDVLEKKR